MRILLVNKFLYPRGGAERAVLALGEALRRRGHDVFWFGMQHPDNQVTGDQVQLVRRRDYHANGLGRFRDAAGMLYSWEARRKLARFLDRVQPDVVHLHNIYHQLTPSILDATRSRAVPVVMTLHDYKLVCPRYDMLRHGQPCDACVEEGPVACLRYRCGGGWMRSIVLAGESALHRSRGSYDGVQRFLSPSRFLMRVLERAGWSTERFQYVPNALDCASDASHAAQLPKDGHFVYAGRLSAEKGLLTLFDALRQLDRGTCVICGRGPLEARLREIAATLPDGRIEFRGHLPPAQLAFEMQRSSFTVLPSECFENAPLAVLESMRHGRAVLASNLGGIPELVEHGVSGILVPPGNATAWAAALREALASPAQVRGLGREARIRLRERFDFEHYLKSIEDVYREVAA